MSEEQILRRSTIVCFGTSITRGYPYVPEDDTYPAVLERRLNRTLGQQSEAVTVINSGVPGENTVEGLARIDEDVIAHRPDLVVVEFACNDVRYEPEKRVELDDFGANLVEMVERIREVCTEIVICTPTPIVDQFHVYSQEVDFYDPWGGCNNALMEYDQVIREVAAEQELTVCDLKRAFYDRAVESEFDGDTDDAGDLTCIADLISRYDGVHPTVAGQALIALELYRIIRTMTLG
ncbi:MAG: SGNH/GDSL hydrolase family protein [Armatimonadota bacterium]|nr:SGNH/GDSL hydrolase family protein [Armatimonadota bacterium]